MEQENNKKLKILVIDDDLTFRKALCEYLIQKGYTVYPFDNGESAIRKLKEETFDVILLDIYMPEMDGLKVLTKIREEKITTKVIILTAADGLRIVQESVKLGADEFITKPFNLNLLIETIEKLTAENR